MIKAVLKKQSLMNWATKRNLTDRELAHILGYDTGQFSNWIHRVRCVSPKARAKIMKITKLKWDELFRITT